MSKRALVRGFSSLAIALAAQGCGPPATFTMPPDRTLPTLAPVGDLGQFYRDIGLIVAPPPMSLVGKVAYFATRSPDTTLVLTSISMPNRALTFSREGDKYRAPYEVRIKLLQNNVEVASLNALEVVRVGSFKEINRLDESVIFQHYFRVPPGSYAASISVRDIGGARQTTQEAGVLVPRINPGGFSSPTVVYEPGFRESLDSVPRALVSPRSSAVFGVDSSVSIFIEGYGSGASLPVAFTVTDDRNVKVYSGSTVLSRHGNLFAGTVSVPISTVGLGVAKLSFTRRDASDVASIPIFVNFGEDIPVMSFENMIEYLRFFAPSWRLAALKQAPPEKRAAAWTAFLRETDPVPETPVNEDLESYFGRIDQANLRFATDHSPGWLSDRGIVMVALGEPTLVTDRTINEVVGRNQIGESTQAQIWDYPQYRSQLVFYQDGGHWRLTRASESEFWRITSRKLGQH